MDKAHLGDPFLARKASECQLKLSQLRASTNAEDQLEGYRYLLFDVLSWLGLTPRINGSVFDLTLNGRETQLQFWPRAVEEATKKLTSNEVARATVAPGGQVLLSSLSGFEESAIELARSQGGDVLLLDGADINALCGMDWDFRELIGFKMREMALYGQPYVNYLTYLTKKTAPPQTATLTRLEEWLSRGAQSSASLFRENVRCNWVDLEQNIVVRWPTYSAVRALIALKEGIPQKTIPILTGHAGCGKSTYLYLLGYEMASHDKREVYYCNAADLQLNNLEAALEVIGGWPKESVLLLDDLHQRPAESSKLIGAITAEFPKVTVVCATRPPYFAEVSRILRGTYGWREFSTHRVDLETSTVIDGLVAKFTQSTGKRISLPVRELLKRDSAGDLTILGWLLRHVQLESYESDDVGYSAVVRHRLKPIDQDQRLGALGLAALYSVVFFEQFDVRISKSFLVGLGFRLELVDEMIRVGHISEVNNRLQVGHASRARLFSRALLQYTPNDWQISLRSMLGNWEGSVGKRFDDVGVELLGAYFRQRDVAARSQAILNAFNYFVPNAEVTSLHKEMVRIVRGVERSMEMLLSYFQRDPSGENSVSNSAFMCQVFTKLGRLDTALQSLAFILSRQYIAATGQALFELDENRVTTVRDFREIRSRVETEDVDPSPNTVELIGLLGSSASLDTISQETEFDRFHQTWLSAMVLPAIVFTVGREHPRFGPTLKTVLDNQDPVAGWFYPAAFCWSTARCLINLVDIGEAIDSLPVVKARDWLLSIQLQNGSWHSPDWRWNPDEEMTAMCLYAVLKAGVPHDHPRVQLAIGWLKSRGNAETGSWNESPHDTGHVIEALNEIGVPLEQVRASLTFLERRVSTEDWYQTIIGKDRRQSLEIGELANVLLEVETRYLLDYVTVLQGTPKQEE